MLGIPALVDRVAPGLLSSPDESAVVCIRTTRAKFMLLGSRDTAPCCVAQFGAREELERLDGTLARMHAAAPRLVARPLALARVSQRLCMHLQAGLPGRPWFQLQARCCTKNSWERVAGIARSALDEMQQAIAAVPEWTVRLRPGAELREQAKFAAARDVALSGIARDWITVQIERLDSWGEIISRRQHGDFCLNNLLLRERDASIIDFDDFGETAMPLHDELGLERSLRQLGPSMHSPGAIQHEFAVPLYAHYLLWQINKSLDFSMRAAVRAELVSEVEYQARNGSAQLVL